MPKPINKEESVRFTSPPNPAFWGSVCTLLTPWHKDSGLLSCDTCSPSNSCCQWDPMGWSLNKEGGYSLTLQVPCGSSGVSQTSWCFIPDETISNLPASMFCEMDRCLVLSQFVFTGACNSQKILIDPFIFLFSISVSAPGLLILHVFMSLQWTCHFNTLEVIILRPESQPWCLVRKWLFSTKRLPQTPRCRVGVGLIC